MTSGTSSRKWVVFKSALKRLKWLGILYGVALFLETPLLLWMELSQKKSLIQGNLWVEFINKSYLPQFLFHPVEHFVNIAVPVIFGLILFFYLQNDTASTFFHSLPINRVSLYCQNLLAGLTLIWLPILINGLIVYGVFTNFGVTEVRWQNPRIYYPVMDLVTSSGPSIVPVGQVIAYWLFLSLLMTGLFYVFTVFVGMLTGSVLLQGILTFIGSVLPLGLYLLIKFNLSMLLYGFPSNINEQSVEWLSPLVSYLDDRIYRVLFKVTTGYMWYIIAAVLLCGVSIYLYKVRHVEAAGETLAAGWIRRLFKYGVTACAALTGGLYFSAFNQNSTGVLYLGYFIGAVLGYIVADIIAFKSFHFYKRWRGMVVFGAVFCLVISSVKLDFYGYEKYVPDQDKVKAVFLSNLNREVFMATEGLTGEDSIRRVRQLHQRIIKMEKENRAREKSVYKQAAISALRPTEQPRRIIPLNLSYVLDSGRKVKRTYSIDIYGYREFLYPIFNSQQVKRGMFWQLFKMDEDKIDQINIDNRFLGKSVRISKRAEIQEALAALRKDILNVSYETAVENKVPSQANIEFVSKTDFDMQFEFYPFYHLNYYAEFHNFKAFLAERGYLGELFVNPEDVSAIIINQVDTDETVEIKDKQKIKALLNCGYYLDNEKAFLMRQRQPEDKIMTEYYGKIVRINGIPVYIMFDNSPDARQLIYKMLNKE